MHPLKLRNKLLLPIDLIYKENVKKCSVMDNLTSVKTNMKILLVLLTALFSIVILMTAGFQLIRLFLGELYEIFAEVWHSTEVPPSR